MADAYLYAETGTHPPLEYLLLNYIDRFGVEAVLGRRILSAGEIRRMNAVENVVEAFRARKAEMDGGNVAKWATKNPDAARLLSDIERDLDAD